MPIMQAIIHYEFLLLHTQLMRDGYNAIDLRFFDTQLVKPLISASVALPELA